MKQPASKKWVACHWSIQIGTLKSPYREAGEDGPGEDQLAIVYVLSNTNTLYRILGFPFFFHSLINKYWKLIMCRMLGIP